MELRLDNETYHVSEYEYKRIYAIATLSKHNMKHLIEDLISNDQGEVVDLSYVADCLAVQGITMNRVTRTAQELGYKTWWDTNRSYDPTRVRKLGRKPNERH